MRVAVHGAMIFAVTVRAGSEVLMGSPCDGAESNADSCADSCVPVEPTAAGHHAR